jgi:chromosome segregation ATPase
MEDDDTRPVDAPAGNGPDAPWRTEPPPRRRWPLVVLVLLVAGIAVGAGVAAYVNYDTGSAWQDRAEAQQVRAEAAEARLAEVESALHQTNARLVRSEEDVAMLESRLADLASEKAGAEDSAAMAAEAAEDLTAVTVFAAEVGASLRTCVGRNVELVNDMVSSYNAGNFDPPAVNSRIGEVNRVCADAERDYAELRIQLDALGG